MRGMSSGAPPGGRHRRETWPRGGTRAASPKEAARHEPGASGTVTSRLPGHASPRRFRTNGTSLGSDADAACFAAQRPRHSASGGAVGLEDRSAREAALLVEVDRDGGVEDGEFPTIPHASAPRPCPLPSADRKVDILRPVVHPAAGTHPLDATLSDLRGKDQPAPVPSAADGIVADVDAPRVLKALPVAERQGKLHVEHRRQTDDLQACLEPVACVAVAHAGRPGDRPIRLWSRPSDRAASGPPGLMLRS